MSLPCSGGSGRRALGRRAGKGTAQLGNSVVCRGTGTEEGASLLSPTRALTFEQDSNTAETMSPDQLNLAALDSPQAHVIYKSIHA